MMASSSMERTVDLGSRGPVSDGATSIYDARLSDEKVRDRQRARSRTGRTAAKLASIALAVFSSFLRPPQAPHLMNIGREQTDRAGTDGGSGSQAVRLCTVRGGSVMVPWYQNRGNRQGPVIGA